MYGDLLVASLLSKVIIFVALGSLADFAAYPCTAQTALLQATTFLSPLVNK